jgi:epoxyqueuosine reductase
MKNKFENWMFGCDICQDVCPWNRFSKPTNEIAFKPIPEILNLSTEEWEHINEEHSKRYSDHRRLNGQNIKEYKEI